MWLYSPSISRSLSLSVTQPLGPLAPLRSVCDTPVPALRRPLGSSSSLQPLKTPLGVIKNAFGLKAHILKIKLGNVKSSLGLEGKEPANKDENPRICSFYVGDVQYTIHSQLCATPETTCMFFQGALAGTSSGLQRVRQEERLSLAPPTFSSNDKEDEEEKISMLRVCVLSAY